MKKLSGHSTATIKTQGTESRKGDETRLQMHPRLAQVARAHVHVETIKASTRARVVVNPHDPQTLIRNAMHKSPRRGYRELLKDRKRHRTISFVVPPATTKLLYRS